MLYIAATDERLVGLTPENGWDKLKKSFRDITEGDNDILTRTLNQLTEYFNKQRTKFDIPILLHGTEFQKSAWNALLEIPYGVTISYQKQAENIGNLKALRAVGGANSANNIAIIIPCHRVIGKSGKLTGYTGGLDIKKYLLDLEK